MIRTYTRKTVVLDSSHFGVHLVGEKHPANGRLVSVTANAGNLGPITLTVRLDELQEFMRELEAL